MQPKVTTCSTHSPRSNPDIGTPASNVLHPSLAIIVMLGKQKHLLGEAGVDALLRSAAHGWKVLCLYMRHVVVVAFHAIELMPTLAESAMQDRSRLGSLYCAIRGLVSLRR
jgi:hypothetical protein